MTKKIALFVQLQMLPSVSKNWASMVGENFEIHSSRMAKIAPKLFTMVGENFEICLSEIAKNAPKLSTMVVEIFEN